MSYSVGQTVSWRGTLAMVVSVQTVGEEDYVGLVPLQGIQYVPATAVNQPTPPPPSRPGGPPPPPPAPPPAPAPRR